METYPILLMITNGRIFSDNDPNNPFFDDGTEFGVTFELCPDGYEGSPYAALADLENMLKQAPISLEAHVERGATPVPNFSSVTMQAGKVSVEVTQKYPEPMRRMAAIMVDVYTWFETKLDWAYELAEEVADLQEAQEEMMQLYGREVARMRLIDPGCEVAAEPPSDESYQEHDQILDLVVSQLEKVAAMYYAMVLMIEAYKKGELDSTGMAFDHMVESFKLADILGTEIIQVSASNTGEHIGDPVDLGDFGSPDDEMVDTPRGRHPSSGSSDCTCSAGANDGANESELVGTAT